MYRLQSCIACDPIIRLAIMYGYNFSELNILKMVSVNTFAINFLLK